MVSVILRITAAMRYVASVTEYTHTVILLTVLSTKSQQSAGELVKCSTTEITHGKFCLVLADAWPFDYMSPCQWLNQLVPHICFQSLFLLLTT